VSTTPPAATDRARRLGPVQQMVQVWRYRELLGNLTRKELKVKYKNSVLGFAWSLLNPLLYLVVFSLVFTVIMPNGLPYFAFFFMAGLLPWNFFSTALGSATGSVVGSAGLVKKVWFPREILPLASICAAMVHFLLQSLVLAAALLVFTYAPSWEFLILLPLALLAMVTFLAALSIGLSATNVYLRDTGHLLELVILAWFWVTPIVYFYGLVSHKLSTNGIPGWLGLLNPITPTIITFQRAVWGNHLVPLQGSTKRLPALPTGGVGWYAGVLGIVLVASLVLLALALALFGKLEDNFAEEI
jgi:ABC-2 type transport system permease protein